jgi:hypothetical protein
MPSEIFESGSTLQEGAFHHDHGFHGRPTSQGVQQSIRQPSHGPRELRRDHTAPVDNHPEGRTMAAEKVQLRRFVESPDPVVSRRRDTGQQAISQDCGHQVGAAPGNATTPWRNRSISPEVSKLRILRSENPA